MKKGFTLIELLIVVAIIGILAVALVPTGMNALKKARDGTRIAHMATLETALSQWALDNPGGTCPTNMATLSTYFQGTDLKDPGSASHPAYSLGATTDTKYCYAMATLEFGGGNVAACPTDFSTLPTLATDKSGKCQFVYIEK